MKRPVVGNETPINFNGGRLGFTKTKQHFLLSKYLKHADFSCTLYYSGLKTIVTSSFLRRAINQLTQYYVRQLCKRGQSGR